MNNEKNGHGEFMWPNGVRFIGDYKDNEKFGKGKYFFGEADYIEGNFVDGCLVGVFLIQGRGVYIFY